jgi:hypothetical protein
MDKPRSGVIRHRHAAPAALIFAGGKMIGDTSFRMSDYAAARLIQPTKLSNPASRRIFLSSNRHADAYRGKAASVNPHIRHSRASWNDG